MKTLKNILDVSNQCLLFYRMLNSLKCDSEEVLAKDANTKGDDWFEIYDPRNPINKRRREASKKHLLEKGKSRHH